MSSQQPPYTPLLNAILRGKKIKKILSKLSGNINTLGEIGFAALHFLLQQDKTSSNNLKYLKQLLAHRSIDVNVHTQSGFTPLHIATQERHLLAIELLLQHPDVDPNAFSQSDGSTPLCFAAANGYVQEVEKLLAHEKTDVNQAKFTGFTPLIMACQRRSNHQVVRLLLASQNINPNCVAMGGGEGDDASWDQGVFPLRRAAQDGDVRLVSMLLEHPLTNVNMRPPKVGVTALVCAVENRHEDVVTLLCRHATINVRKRFYVRGGKGKKGTPLYMAAQHGHAGCCQILLEHGAAPDLYTRCTALKHSPLETATVHGAVGTVKLLKEAMEKYTEGGGADAEHGGKGEESSDEYDEYEEGYDTSIFEQNMIERLHLETMKISNNCSNCSLKHSSFETEVPPFKKCSKCQRVYYCSRECQIKHWKRKHKQECPKLVELGPPREDATTPYCTANSRSRKPVDQSSSPEESSSSSSAQKKKKNKNKKKKKKRGAKLMPVRFPIGTKIECLGPDGMFGLGIVVDHHYRELDWEAGMTAPYQVRMNKDNCLVYCKVDSDDIISGPVSDEMWEKHAV